MPSAVNNRMRSDSDAKGPSRPGRRGKMPVLVSVSLRNLCPLSKEELQMQSKNKKWFRPEYATTLLNRVRLDIVIAPPSKDDKGEKKTENNSPEISSEINEEKVIYSSVAPIKTINPSWSHLDETIEDYLKLDGYFDSETGFYRYMRLRIWILPENDTADVPDLAPGHVKHGLPLMDISIHPTKLARLARAPERVPINSLILHFSDGSVRASASLRDLLGDQDGSHSDENLKDEFGRFGDDVFRTLDSVTPVKKKTQAPGSSRDRDQTDPSNLSTNSEDSNDREPPHSEAGMSGDKRQQQQLLTGMNDKFVFKESDAAFQDSTVEQQELERLILMEEAAIKGEIQSLEQAKSDMHTLMEKSSEIEANMALLEDVIQNEMRACRKTEFFLEAIRMKLLKDLRSIYPISIPQGEDKYSIRGLRVPADIHAGGVGEDELSAALGFLCHLISLMSKYMGIQLRYRVVCNSSRSAIQDDSGAILPLFQARAVERDQLDYGVLMLHRNVECILKNRNIEYQSQEHILVKLNLVFTTIVDGDD